MKDIQNKCRRLLLRDGYGRFALVEKVIPQDRLLADKPMLIFMELNDLLGNKVQLNRNSFYTWLRRWRKRNQQNSILPAQKGKNWLDYQPAPLSVAPAANDGVVIEFTKPQ